ncbi:MAG: exodeoxyribonuclease VII large subunit [Candidatus Omnitrophica bacterium]|nr:exodeoxyribonuclease VII large subunit [Candidatus Omnitrophota bacterium]
MARQKVEVLNAATALDSGRRIYKVSEITREIRLLLEDRFPAVWIEGEISNLKKHSSGHIYFTLKDEAAQINAVFFSRQNQFLKFELEDGLHVIAIGRISVYDVRGNYQLYVERMEPKGLGALQLAFLQLKEKLEKEGLFDPARKKEIPQYPKRIGIVTSPTGAALQDMLKVFKRISVGLHVQVSPVRVQGEGAGLEVAHAIDEFNKKGGVDVLIVGRGGGSLEDLWAFNEEVVARAVFKSHIPIISAVGHEIDWTICDLVADHRAHTPTAAAEHLVFYWNELEAHLKDFSRRLEAAILLLLRQKKENLNALQSSYAFKQPLTFVRQISQTCDELARQLENYIQSLMDRKRHSFQVLIEKLNTLSPLSVLERGYSITFDARDRVVRKKEMAPIGSFIRTRFRKGLVESKVTKHLEAEELNGR